MVHAGSVAIDVHPPRASARAKRWRRHWQPLRAWKPALAQAAHRLERSFLGSWDPGDVSESAVIQRMVIPGWPQIYCGRVLRGRILLGVWSMLLGGGLLYAGTSLGSLLLGMAVSVHVASALELALDEGASAMERLVRAALTLVLIVCLVYLPAVWLIGRVATPRQLLADSGPLNIGDVVLVNRSMYAVAEPEIGDLVLYEIPEADLTGRTDAGYNARFLIRGPRMDRILAQAGQQITYDQGRLTVNGVASSLRPLNPGHLPASLSLTVPADSYLILPSSDHNLTEQVIREVCIVPRSRIEGQVYWQTQPLSAFGVIR